MKVKTLARFSAFFYLFGIWAGSHLFIYSESGDFQILILKDFESVIWICGGFFDLSHIKITEKKKKTKKDFAVQNNTFWKLIFLGGKKSAKLLTLTLLFCIFFLQLEYAGRKVHGTPATGVGEIHKREIEEIVKNTFQK